MQSSGPQAPHTAPVTSLVPAGSTAFPAEIGSIGDFRANRVDLDSSVKVHHLPTWKHRGDPVRIKALREIALTAGRDPRMATLAVSIVRGDASAWGSQIQGAKPRDTKGQSALLLRWVQGLYYVNEPGERLQDPLYTVQVGYGDCLPEDTLLLRDDYEFVPISEIKPGDRIWGRDRWSRVQKAWETGEKRITRVHLSNGETLKASENHKLFAWSCPLHGTACPDWTERRGNCRHRDKTVVEVRVSDVHPGMRLLRPERIEAGSTSMDPDCAWVEGLFLADGWFQHTYHQKNGTERAYDFAIAGKDGHPKEAQKLRVRALCDGWGIPTTMTDRWVVVRDSGWASDLLSVCGHGAAEKRARTLDLDAPAVAALCEGIGADSGYTASGSQVFGTVSDTLSLQMRVLWHMQGRACSRNTVEAHGGVGHRPIHRMTPYKDRLNAPHTLTVRSIDRECETAVCWDVTTDDHYVYLPESDVVVHNCDDLSMLLAALAESLRIPWRYVLSGRNDRGKTIRWVEGERIPRAKWAHIYVALGDRPFTPKRWAFAEPTIRGVPLGWDVVQATNASGRVVLPELAGPDLGSAETGPDERAPMMVRKREHIKPFWNHVRDEVKDRLQPRKVVPLIITGIIIGALSDRVRRLFK